MNRRGVLAALAGAGTVFAIGGYNQLTGSPGKTSGPPTLDCAEKVISRSTFVPTANDLVVGPLAFAHILAHAPTWEFGADAGPEGIKARIVLAPGAVVTLVVPDPDRDHVALAYGPRSLDTGSVADAYHAVRFEACDAQQTQWAGGLIVTDPRCVTLEVWINDEEQPRAVTIPVGVTHCRHSTLHTRTV